MPHPFQNAALPQSFYPHAFIKTMLDGFLRLDRALSDFNEYAYRAETEYEIAEGKISADNQRGISILYDNMITCGREALLFMALCRKNIAFMPDVTARIHPHVLTQTQRRVWPRAFAHDDFIQKQMAQFSAMFFDSLEKLVPLISEETWQYRERTPFRGDPYLIEIRPYGPLTRLDYNDWLEFNFFRLYRLPLGLYHLDARVGKSILRQTDHPVYRKQVAERIWKKRLHVHFPGLTLDPDGQDPSELERLSKHLGPHVLFTPDRTARFGTLTFRPQ